MFPPGRETPRETLADRIRDRHHDYWNRRRRLPGGLDAQRRPCDDHIDACTNEVGRQTGEAVVIAVGKTPLDLDAVAFDKTDSAHALAEAFIDTCRRRAGGEKADAPQFGLLLRKQAQRRRHCGAAKQCPQHSAPRRRRLLARSASGVKLGHGAPLVAQLSKGSTDPRILARAEPPTIPSMLGQPPGRQAFRLVDQVGWPAVWIFNDSDLAKQRQVVRTARAHVGASNITGRCQPFANQPPLVVGQLAGGKRKQDGIRIGRHTLQRRRRGISPRLQMLRRHPVVSTPSFRFPGPLRPSPSL